MVVPEARSVSGSNKMKKSPSPSEQSEARESEPAEARDHRRMTEALKEAEKAAAIGEVPVGALVVCRGRVIGRGYNRREIDADPVAHAEILAIRQAAQVLGDWRLVGCTLYVTLEPCAMCAGALINSRIARLVFGAHDPKGGYCQTLGNLVQDPRLNHQVEMVGGVLRAESARLLKEFFRGLRSRG
jgi:tRNA(adenine34) deaminase